LAGLQHHGLIERLAREAVIGVHVEPEEARVARTHGVPRVSLAAASSASASTCIWAPARSAFATVSARARATPSATARKPATRVEAMYPKLSPFSPRSQRVSDSNANVE